MKKAKGNGISAGILLPVIVGIMMLTAVGCGKNDGIREGETDMVSGTVTVSQTGRKDDIVKGGELICSADDEAQAREIAGLYGIELVRFEYGVATFHTDDDPAAVIQKGKDNGWKELSVNRMKEEF